MFVVLEGIDGSGTTSLAQNLVRRIAKSTGEARLGLPPELRASYTQEPTQCPLGKYAREMMSRPGTSLEHWRQALVFAADRLEHCENIIGPLSKDRILICDRYLLSSLVYQKHVTREMLMALNRDALKPDLTLWLDVSATTANKRIEQRKQPRDPLENVKSLYDLAMRYSEEVYSHWNEDVMGEVSVINAEASEEDVLEVAFERIASRYREVRKGA